MGLFGKKTPKAGGAKPANAKQKPQDFRKLYPFLSKVKIPEVVPAVTLNTLDEIAHGDETQRGAVREANDKSGYLVAMISEAELVNVGFAEKSQNVSAGQFIQGVKRRLIKSATLRNDLNDGFMTIIPSTEGLRYLSNIPECERLKYQLALFPAAIDDEENLRCEPLKLLGNNNPDGLASYGDLMKISDSNTELVIDREKGTVASTEFVDSLSDGDDEVTDPAGELGKGGKLSEYDPTDIKPVDEIEDLDDDFMNELDETPVDEEPGNDDVEEDAPDDVDDYLNNDDDDDLLNLDIPGEEDYLGETEDAPVDEEPEEEPVNDEPEYDEEDAKAYASDINELADKEIDLSSDLYLNASTADIEAFYSIKDAPHLELVESDNDELQKRLNVLRSTFNSNLNEYLIDRRNQRLTEYANRLNDAVKKVTENVSVDSNSEFKAEFEKLKAEYDETDAEMKKEVSVRISRLREEYDKDKNDFVDAAAKQASVEYEGKHKAKLNQDIKDVEADFDTKAVLSYNQGLVALNERRKSEAQTQFSTLKSEILADLRDAFKADDDEIHGLYNKFKQEVSDELNRSYANEVARVQNIKDANEHDHTISDLRNEIEEAKAQHKQELSKLNSDLTRDFTKKLDNKVEEVQHLKETVEHLERNHQSDIDSLKSEYENRSETYKQQLSDITNQYHDKIEQDEVEYKRYSTTRRNHVIISVVSVAVALILGFFIGNALTGSKSGNTTTTTTQPSATYIIPSQQGTTTTTQSTQQNTSGTNYSNNKSQASSSSSNETSSKTHKSETKNSTDTKKSNNQPSGDEVDNH